MQEASGDGHVPTRSTCNASSRPHHHNHSLACSPDVNGNDEEDDESDDDLYEDDSLFNAQQNKYKKSVAASSSCTSSAVGLQSGLTEVLPPEAVSSKYQNLKHTKCTNSAIQFAYTQEQLLNMNSRSPEWMKIPKSEKEKLGLVFEDDGEFWIPFEDFAAEFTDLSICQLVNTSLFSLRKTWNENTVIGQWTRPYRAGGCPNHDTFLRNPQYYFDIPKDDTEIMGQIIQTDRREHRNEHSSGSSPPTEYQSIGFHIMRVEDNREHRLHKMQPKAVTSDYCKMRSMFFQGELDKGRYVIVPTTFEPNVETEFIMRIYSDTTLLLKEMTHDYPEHHWICTPFCPTFTCVTVITVEGASDLKSENTYCIVKVENQTLRSHTVEGTFNPEWNLKGIFFRTDVCKPIIIELWENKMLQRDHFLGNAILTGSADNQLLSVKAPLVGRGHKQSEQHPGELRVKFVTYDDLDAA